MVRVPRIPPLFPIDEEWAATLVGLRVLVPDSWWPEYITHNLNAGKIVSVDFSDEAGRFWALQLDADVEDGEEETTYLMRYDAVLLYADAEDSWYENFNLPNEPIASPENERVMSSATTGEGPSLRMTTTVLMTTTTTLP